MKRRKLGIQDHDDVLFFKLHPKKAHHQDYQHNILYNLGQNESCVAAYICPIFLKADQFRSAVNSLTANHCMLWNIENERHLIDDSSWISADMSLVLNTHAAIKPHKPVTTAKHQYSFDADCKNIVFHSPEKVGDNYIGLGGLLNSTLQALKGKSSEGMQIFPKTSLEKLTHLVSSTASKAEGLNPFEFIFADTLESKEESKDFSDNIKYWIR